MNKLAKIGAIGFGVLAFSELCGITGEAQAFAGMIAYGQLEAEEVYALLDEFIDAAEGYTKFKIKMVKVFTSNLVKCLG